VEIVYTHIAAIDVGKKEIAVTVRVPGQRPGTRAQQTRKFRTFYQVLRQMVGWLIEQGVTHVAMEATGVYWKPVFHALAEAETVLTSDPAGRTAYLQADLRHPEQILADPDLRTTVDLGRPVAVLLVAVLHFLPDHDQAYTAVRTLMDAVPAGSYLVISHATTDLLPAATVSRLTGDGVPGAADFTARTHTELARLFAGLTMVDPGLAVISRWRPDPDGPPPPPDDQVSVYGAVARKPGSTAT
jgi:hypothetical protein